MLPAVLIADVEGRIRVDSVTFAAAPEVAGYTQVEVRLRVARPVVEARR
jgi:hypothetical protein